MRNINIKKLILTNLPYLMLAWVFNKICQGFRLADGVDITGKIMSFPSSIVNVFQNLTPSIHIMDVLIGIAGAVVIRLAVYTKAKNAKKYRHGMEYVNPRSLAYFDSISFWWTIELLSPCCSSSRLNRQ